MEPMGPGRHVDWMGIQRERKSIGIYSGDFVAIDCGLLPSTLCYCSGDGVGWLVVLVGLSAVTKRRRWVSFTISQEPKEGPGGGGQQ